MSAPHKDGYHVGDWLYLPVPGAPTSLFATSGERPVSWRTTGAYVVTKVEDGCLTLKDAPAAPPRHRMDVIPSRLRRR